MHFFSVFTTLFVVMSTFSSAYANSLDGLYLVKGQDSEKGSYQGVVQIKVPQIIRIVRFKDIRFYGNEVETIWSGKISGDLVQFMLKPTEILTSFNDYRLTAEQMKTPTIINKIINVSGQIQFLNSIETWTLTSNDPGEILWQSQRKRTQALPTKPKWFLKVADFIGLGKALKIYRDLGAKSPWGNRPEFINKEQWIISDTTDYDFYQNNPTVVRVTNKTLNPVSLAEATTRKNAYGKKLSDKAKFFEKETKKYNLNSSGMLEMAIIDKNRNKVSGYADYDSTLWTGMYVWSQVLRYKQTQDPEAYENVKAALKGLLILTEITEDPTQFARTVIESPSNEKIANDGLVQGKGKYSHLKWQKIGNNDMSKGFFISFTTAYSVLKKEDADLKNQIAEATKRLVNFAPIKKRSANLGIAYGLVALYNKDPEALRDYSNHSNNIITVAADGLDLDSGFIYDAVTDWSGIHLTMVSRIGGICASNRSFLET